MEAVKWRLNISRDDRMSWSFPEAMQIEVTNKCNFNCLMCIRHVWKAEPVDLDLDLYKKIAKLNFPMLKRLILYGLGEPLTNPFFLHMLKTSRRYLPKESEIIFSTNGSLLTPRLAEEMLRKIGVNSISFSIDTTDIAKLSNIRKGSQPRIIMDNFQYVAKIKNTAKNTFKLGVEAVIMKENVEDLPLLVKNLAEKDIDYIIVSHVVPYTEHIFRRSVYVTLSKPSFEIIKSSLKHGWNLIREASFELLGRTYGINTQFKAAKIIKKFWENADKNGYWINLPLLFDSADKIEMIEHVEEIFRKSRKIADEYQIDLKLPNLYPDAKKRSCPYVDKSTVVVRSDGKVVPCLEFAYSHPMYINTHMKEVNEIILGDLKKEKLEDIWNKDVYVKFRETRKNFVKNIPWCGDCPYSTLGCFFTKTNELDCYANEPACNECIYSVGLAQCNI